MSGMKTEKKRKKKLRKIIVKQYFAYKRISIEFFVCLFMGNSEWAPETSVTAKKDSRRVHLNTKVKIDGGNGKI